MLRYFYTKEKDRLYVYDRESGFFQAFDQYKNEWVTPYNSFSQIEHDNDDFALISEEAAKQISKGVSFEEKLKTYLAIIGK